MYSVVIVEDDPMIAELNRRYVEKDGRFGPVQCFTAPRPALDWLHRHPADLVILDFYMPQMNGLAFLQAVRAAGIASDVIMITTANDAATVEALTRLGIVDYLVKPFAYERFCQALDSFCRRREAMRSGGNLDQSALDSLLHDTIPTALPKGLQPPTLERILDCLRKAGKPLTGEAIAAAAGLSAVTVRRYMAYLLEHHLVAGEMDYSTGGRPCLVYHMIR